ncbi:hypothetical protein JTB14_006935 [Gonioctena quinquepunctata]|nr:hypothetical protein JTB14_006935 [Gonioctena quinquepunctata]
MFQQEVDLDIQYSQATVRNYKNFVNILHEAAKKSISRGHRKLFISGWTSDIEEFEKDHDEMGDPQITDQIMRSSDNARARRWKYTTEEMNFTRSSRKGWSLHRRLGSATPPPEKTQNINPNDIADRLVITSKIPPADRTFVREIKKEAKTACRSLPQASPWSHAFSMRELNEALGRMKMRMVPGPDGVFPESLRNLDMALANQHNPQPQKTTTRYDLRKPAKSLELESDQLTDDLEAMHDYYTKWCLKPNPLKSEVCVFHLSNRESDITPTPHT